MRCLKNLLIIVSIPTVFIFAWLAHRYIPVWVVRNQVGLPLPLNSRQLSVENGEWYQIRFFKITPATINLLAKNMTLKKPVPLMLTTLINDGAGLPEWQYDEISKNVYIVFGALNRSEAPIYLWIIRFFEDNGGDSPP